MQVDLSHYPHRFPRDIHLHETDAFGHLNNVSFVAYMEEARFSLFRQMKIFDPKDLFTLELILAKIECEYRKIVRYGDKITIYTRVLKIGSSSFTLEHLFLREGDETVVARGRAVLVSFDHESGRPKPLPEQLKRKLRKYVGGPES